MRPIIGSEAHVSGFTKLIMLTFITIAALGLAVIVFLNLIAAGSKSSRKKDARFRSGGKGPYGSVSDVKRFLQADKDPALPRARICPVCGAGLEQEDFLYAALEAETEGRRRQAQIYGCRYCLDGSTVRSQKGEELSCIEP